MLFTRPQKSSVTNGVPGDSPAENPNRRIQRISLPLPVRIEVKVDSRMSWTEITRLSDVSAFGAGFTLKRPIKRGRLVQLTIPMPRQLRSYDYSETQYKVWSLVRRCIETGTNPNVPEYAIGVAFVGKNPPPDFLEHPSMLYDITTQSDEGAGLWQIKHADLMADESHLPKEIRKQTRLFIPEPLMIERVDDFGEIVESEATVTENISFGGAAVFTSLKAEAGSFLRVTSERFNVTILSVVRTARPGTDGITRLHLEFIDRFFPLEGIE